MSLRLSVLDQSPISDGMTAGEALRNSVDLAQFVEARGYTRYWVAEHHGTVMLAGTTPEILIGPLAAATRQLRIGSGGVMLPHYSPLKVAETFDILNALYPDRIDLAVGRAAGTDPLTAFALQRDRRMASPDDFPEQLTELLCYVRDGFPAGHRFGHLRPPHLPSATGPRPWLLGSSAQSGVWAAQVGLPYAFADFIYPGGAEIARRYRESFAPSKSQPAPYVIVAAWALCAESDEEARRLASSSRMAFAHYLGGHPIPVPPIETALEFLEEHPDSLAAVGMRRRAIIGTPDLVRDQLTALAEEYSADEVMVVTITYDHGARRRSYELLGQAFQLSIR